MMNQNNNNVQSPAAVTFISLHSHGELFKGLTDAMRAYAAAINAAVDSDVSATDTAMQAAAAEFLKPYGMEAGYSFMAMLRADVALKKVKDSDVRVFSVPSGATVRKYLRTEVFPRIGLEWQSCVKRGEKRVKAAKAAAVDFGSMSVEDIVNGMSADKFAEFAAAFAARSAAAAEIAAD